MLSESEEIKISFDTLERGQMYPIMKIERTESCFYGKKVPGLKVTIDDDGTLLITYLPKKLVESINDQEFQKIETAAQTEERYSVCYYGKLKTKNVETFTGRIHPPGQGRFEKLMIDMEKVMNKYTPTKRGPGDDEGSSNSKMAKQD